MSRLGLLAFIEARVYEMTAVNQDVRKSSSIDSRLRPSMLVIYGAFNCKISKAL